MNDPERAKLIEELSTWFVVEYSIRDDEGRSRWPMREVQAALSELDERGRQLERYASFAYSADDEYRDWLQFCTDAGEKFNNALDCHERKKVFSAARRTLEMQCRAAVAQLDERGRRIEEMEAEVAALRSDYNHVELARYRGLDRAGGVSND